MSVILKRILRENDRLHVTLKEHARLQVITLKELEMAQHNKINAIHEIPNMWRKEMKSWPIHRKL